MIRRGYTVRPTTLPLEAAPPSEGGPEDHGSASSSNFHALRAPVKFDTDAGNSTPGWSPHGREDNGFPLDDGPHIHIHRVTCNDFPSTWQPARRIITFMSLVSLACTLLVVVIILVAVALSRTAAQPAARPTELVYLVPQPRRFLERPPTLVVHRRNPRIWQRHVEDLATLLRAYRERQGAAANCDLHYSSIGVSACSFPLDRISDNCSAQNNFGYDSGNPCVALVFNAYAGWIPVPFNRSDPPDAIRGHDLQHMLPLTCSATAPNDQFAVHYSPFPGFPYRYLPLRGMGAPLPPLVMIQFIGSQTMADVEVACTLWAKNLPQNDTNSPGFIKFSLFIV